MKDNELAVIEKENALTVFSKGNGLDPYLEKIKQEIELFVPDTTTKKGRDEIASMAYKVAKSKTYLDGLGKDLVAEMKELPKKIDAERKRMRETLDAWRDDVRQPLTEWEEQEAIRIAKIQSAIAGIESYANMDGLQSVDIANNIDLLELIKIDEWYGDFQVQALLKKEDLVKQLRAELPKRKQYEQEQEELARLRTEAVERERVEREQRIVQEAVEAQIKKQQAAAQAAVEEAEQEKANIKAQHERRELELQLEIEKSKRAAVEAIEKAAAEVAAKDLRAQQERDAEMEQQRKRELDRDHQAKVNNEAVSSFLALGMTEQMAKQAVTAIAKKLIKNVTINY